MKPIAKLGILLIILGCSLSARSAVVKRNMLAQAGSGAAASASLGCDCDCNSTTDIGLGGVHWARGQRIAGAGEAEVVKDKYDNTEGEGDVNTTSCHKFKNKHCGSGCGYRMRDICLSGDLCYRYDKKQSANGSAEGSASGRATQVDTATSATGGVDGLGGASLPCAKINIKVDPCELLGEETGSGDLLD